MDWLLSAAFLIVCECASLPLRAALLRAPMPPDARRVLGRVAGPACIVLPLWALAHAWPAMLGTAFGRTLLGGLMIVALMLWLRAMQLKKKPVSSKRACSNSAMRSAWGIEAMTLLLYFGFVALRRWAPEMTNPELNLSAGAEKFANQMIFWSCWHARALPPEDLWLAGEPLSYYYWGHFHWAWLGRIGGLPATAVVTLALARASAMVWESAYLLGRALKLRPMQAGAAALAAAWGGNPDALLEAWRIVSESGLNFAGYPFWNPSRAIDPARVVSEFPAFSAILGDFHAHHLALPWMTAFVAVLVAGARWSGWRGDGGAARRAGIAMGWTALAAALAAATTIANLWNLPLVFFALALWCAASLIKTSRAPRAAGAASAGQAAAIAAAAIGVAVFVAAASALMRHGAALPLPSRAGQNIFSVAPLSALASAMPETVRARLLAAPIMPLPATLRTTPGNWLLMWGWPALLMLAAFCFRAVLGRGGAGCRRNAWMLGGAFAVLIGLEFVYVADRFEGDLVRYNSYFKFCYPVWPLMWAGGWALLYRQRKINSAPNARRLRGVLCTAVLACALVYPVCAWPARLAQARANDLSPRSPTLDSVAFVQRQFKYAAEAPVLRWIRENVPPGDVVLEAPGEKGYEYRGRVASLAGRPIPMGWVSHEYQWRLPGATLDGRAGAVDSLYKDGRAWEAGPPVRLRDGLILSWAIFGPPEMEQFGMDALSALRANYPVAVSFPPEEPAVWLFDLRSHLKQAAGP